MSYFLVCFFKPLYNNAVAHRSRSVHARTGECKGPRKFSCLSPCLLPLMRHLCHIFPSFRLLSWPPLHAKHLPHPPHNKHFAFIRICHVCLCSHNNSSSASPCSSSFMNFLVLSHIRYKKLLSRQQGSSLSPGSTSNLFVPTGTQK
jgi:hypothetical protein